MASQNITIIVQKTFQSIASDAFSVAAAFLLIGTGVYAESAAMQWVGFILFFTMILSRSGMKGVFRVSSTEAARKVLDNIDAEATE